MTEVENTGEEESQLVADQLTNIGQFRAWIDSQKYLPNNLSDIMLLTFQKWCSTEEQLHEIFTKYFIYRQIYEKIFRNRCQSCIISKKYSAIRACTITLDTADSIVICAWLTNGDVDKFSFYQLAKYIFNEIDLILQEQGGLRKKLTVVFDMELFTRQHRESITQYCALVVTKVFKAVPLRIGEILLVNAPDFVAEFTVLYEFDFHIIDSVEDLTAFIPQAYLPCDLGGYPDSPSKEDFYQAYEKRMGLYNSVLAFDEMERDKELALRYCMNHDEGPKKMKTDKEIKENKKGKKGKGKGKGKGNKGKSKAKKR